jgi:predicted nucleic-acid-binding Zn-ribbon protein
MNVILKCPDCKIGLGHDDLVDSALIDPKGDGIGYEIPVFKCPKCGVEYQEDELDEETP